MTTTVINVNSLVPEIWVDDPNYVYIGRRGKGQEGYFGNPFELKDYNYDREEVLRLYKEWFDKRIMLDGEFWQQILSLMDKTLVCFCKPKACHGDIIAEFLNDLDDRSLVVEGTQDTEKHT